MCLSLRRKEQTLKQSLCPKVVVSPLLQAAAPAPLALLGSTFVYALFPLSPRKPLQREVFAHRRESKGFTMPRAFPVDSKTRDYEVRSGIAQGVGSVLSYFGRRGDFSQSWWNCPHCHCTRNLFWFLLSPMCMVPTWKFFSLTRKIYPFNFFPTPTPAPHSLCQAFSLCGEWIAGRAVWQRWWRLKWSGGAEGKELLPGAPWVTLCQEKELGKRTEEKREPSGTLVSENWILISILAVRLCPFFPFGN